jgi:uncharacterized protein (DUF697 family)
MTAQKKPVEESRFTLGQLEILHNHSGYELWRGRHKENAVYPKAAPRQVGLTVFCRFSVNSPWIPSHVNRAAKRRLPGIAKPDATPHLPGSSNRSRMLDKIVGLRGIHINSRGKSLTTLQSTDSETFWRKLAARHGVWLPDSTRIKDVPLDRLDAIAKTLIHKAERTALVQGVGLGFGGAATVLPDASFLSAIMMRLTQRLCLVYGIENHENQERHEMWKAAAAAAGIDFGKGLAEKHVLRKFAPQVAERLVSRANAEVAKRWAARLVPIASSALGGAINFSLVRTWGWRLQRDLRARYLEAQSDSAMSCAAGDAASI